jgi:hypothetical protein
MYGPLLVPNDSHNMQGASPSAPQISAPVAGIALPNRRSLCMLRASLMQPLGMLAAKGIKAT